MSVAEELVEIIKDERGERGKSYRAIAEDIKSMPPADPERRYTVEELRVFQHGISLSLLSKRSSQHWSYDEDTAKEIEFLEQLYEKVDADMRSKEDEID